MHDSVSQTDGCLQGRFCVSTALSLCCWLRVGTVSYLISFTAAGVCHGGRVFSLLVGAADSHSMVAYHKLTDVYKVVFVFRLPSPCAAGYVSALPLTSFPLLPLGSVMAGECVLCWWVRLTRGAWWHITN